MTSQYIVGGKGDQGDPGPPVADGDKGDIIVSASGLTYTIDVNVVTLAKMAQVATARILGRVTAGTGNVEALTAANVLSMIGVTAGADVNTTAIQVLTNKRIVLSAGDDPAGSAALKFTTGDLLTVAEAGAEEYDGVSRFFTINATEGRGQVPVEQWKRLVASGGAITTIANFFGSNSNPILLPSQWYELEVYALFLKGTAGTVTWTFTNSGAPNWQNIDYEMSPITGIVAPPGTATALKGQIVADATAARTIVTGSLTDAVNHYMRTKFLINNNAGTSLLLQATVGTGQITPLKGSFWRMRRLSLSDVGNFAA